METSNKIKDIVKKLYYSMKEFVQQGTIDFSELEEYEFYFVSEDGHIYFGIIEWLRDILLNDLWSVRILDNETGLVLGYDQYKKISFCDFYESKSNVIYAVCKKGSENYMAKEHFAIPFVMKNFVMDTAMLGNPSQSLPYTLAYSDNICVYVSKYDFRYGEHGRDYKPYILDDSNGAYNNANNFIITTDEIVANDEKSKTSKIFNCDDGLYTQLTPEEFEKLCSYSKYDANLRLEFLSSKFDCNILASSVLEQIQKKNKNSHDIPAEIKKVSGVQYKNSKINRVKKISKISAIITGAVAAVCVLGIGIYLLARKPYFTTLGYRRTHTIASYRGFSKSVNLPSNFEYRKMESVADNAFKSSKIRSVSMADSYHYIGKGAFSDCVNLSEISLSSKLREIDDEAFANCDLHEIVIPENVYYLGKDILKGNPISKITVGKKLAQKYPEAFSSFVDNEYVEFIYTDDSKTFDPSTYFKITSQNDKTKLYMEYFPLEHLEIPEGVTELSADYSFPEESNIETIKLPSTLVNITSEVFCESKITSIVLPDSLEIIPTDCFYGCKQLSEIKLGKNIKKIERHAFSNTAITEFTIPENVTVIPSDCFSGCTKLRTVKIHPNVVEIGPNAFSSTAIESIILPENLIEISDRCFSYSKLKEIKIPYGVTKIGSYVFKGCEELENIVIPDTVDEISFETFAGTKIKKLELPKSLKQLYTSTIKDCNELEEIKMSRSTSFVMPYGKTINISYYD